MQKKRLIQFLILCTMICMPILSYGSTKIISVNLKIDMESDEYLMGEPDLDVTTKNKNYSVSGYEITSGLDKTFYDEGNNMIGNQNVNLGPGASLLTQSENEQFTKKSIDPVTCEITLSANEGFVFYTMSNKDIKISGLDAICDKVSREDLGKSLILTVQLPGIKSIVGSVREAGWKDNHTALWDPATNASTYSVRLYRDEKPLGKPYETSARTFDFAPLMLRPGNYSYSVKAICTDDQTGNKTNSDITTITNEMADQFKEKYSLVYETLEAESGPSDERKLLNGGWQINEEKYWYRLSDGMYPQNMWLNINDDWYFFDSNGYMVTDQWINWKGDKYYMSSDGPMREAMNVL